MEKKPLLVPESIAIDLGLTVKWAPYNVGANSPEDTGDYFAWGETEPKYEATLEKYKFYDPDLQNPTIGTNICGTKYDVARVKWGGHWRLPTIIECRELVSRCDWEEITIGGMVGNQITGPNGNSIFLPSAGFLSGCEKSYFRRYGLYRSGDLAVDDDEDWGGWGLSCYANIGRADMTWGLYYGHSVRPVIDK